MVRGAYELTSLVDQLHAGACDEQAWGAALDRFSDCFAGSAVVIGQEGGGPEGNRLDGHRFDPCAVDLISGPLASPDANPFLAAMPTLQPGRSHFTRDACGDDALVRSALFEQALHPFGMRHIIGGILGRTAGRTSVVSLVRPEARGDFDDHERALLDRLMPSVATAVHLRDQFRACRSVARMATDLIADFGQGLILADRDGRIRHQNREADRIFALDDGLSWRRGLATSDGPASTRLRHAMREGRRAAIAVERPSGRPPYVVTVMPAPAETGAETLLLIADPARDWTVDLDLLADLYGLTNREACLAVALAGGMALAEAAAMLSISMNTAKTHLQAIFGKVGVSRQAGLVRRLLIDLRGCGH